MHIGIRIGAESNTPWYRPEMFTRDTKKVERYGWP